MLEPFEKTDVRLPKVSEEHVLETRKTRLLPYFFQIHGIFTIVTSYALSLQSNIHLSGVVFFYSFRYHPMNVYINKLNPLGVLNVTLVHSCSGLLFSRLSMTFPFDISMLNPFLLGRCPRFSSQPYISITSDLFFSYFLIIHVPCLHIDQLQMNISMKIFLVLSLRLLFHNNDHFFSNAYLTVVILLVIFLLSPEMTFPGQRNSFT